MRKDALVSLAKKYDTPAAIAMSQHLQEDISLSYKANHQNIPFQFFSSSRQDLTPKESFSHDARNFSQFLSGEEEKMFNSPDSLLEGREAGPVLENIVLPFLDAETTLRLSSCSFSFYGKTASASCWKDKLLKAGCNPAALHQIMKGNAIENYRILFCHLQKMLPKDVPELTAWELCCLSGEPSAVEWAEMHAGLTCHSEGINHYTALHYAAMINSLPLLKYCVQKMQMAANTMTPSGETLLHIAAKYDSVDVLRLGATHLGLSTDTRGKFGANPLLYAAWGGAINTLALCLDELGIDIDSTDEDGSKVVHYAAWSGSFNVIRYCAGKRHFVANLRDNHHMMPLHFSAWSGSYDAICLVRYIAHQQRVKCRISALDFWGDNAFWFADNSPHPEKANAALNLDINDLCRYMKTRFFPNKNDEWNMKLKKKGKPHQSPRPR